MHAVELHKVSKRFNNLILFKEIHFQFEIGQVSAILGDNGSGKSTLLQIISGYQKQSSGDITYHSSINSDKLYQFLSIAAPYLDLYEDFTLLEMVKFYFNFKSSDCNNPIDILRDGMFEESQFDRQIRYFSSGMKQRLKLLLAFYSQVPLILLDEPLSNLDSASTEWFVRQIERKRKSASILICTNNHPIEVSLTDKVLRIDNFR